jgi:single-strand DNA-binding protein
VCRLSVATSRQWTNKQTNETQQETEWHRITVWGKQAESCQKYLAKGRQVYVEGRIRTSSYEDENGVKKYSTEIVAEIVQFLGSKADNEGGGGGGGGGGGSSSKPSNRQPEPDPDDDIPF